VHERVGCADGFSDRLGSRGDRPGIQQIELHTDQPLVVGTGPCRFAQQRHPTVG
jgi:hypothetical protein